MQDCSCDNTSRINPTLDLHCVVKEIEKKEEIADEKKIIGNEGVDRSLMCLR